MLKKVFITMLATSVISVSGLCFAEGSDANTSTLELSLKRYHYYYKETVDHTFLDSESGWFGGKRISFKNQDNSTRQFWRILYEKSEDKTHYKGGLQDMAGNYLGPAEGTTDNTLVTGEFIIANPIADSQSAYAYIGYGYRNWDRNLDYMENYRWKYIPVGYRNEYKINDQWSGAVDICIRYNISGRLKISEAGFDNTEVNLGRGFGGFKVELPYTYKMSSACSLLLTPWYDYMESGKSNSVPITQNGSPVVVNGSASEVHEPASTSHRYGIDFGLTFQF